jgi:hypothetical protein
MDELIFVVGILFVIAGLGFYYTMKTINQNNTVLIRKIDKIAEIVIGNKYR